MDRGLQTDLRAVEQNKAGIVVRVSNDVAVDLAEISDGELLELMVPSPSMSRRLLVVWLYLQQRTGVSLREFEQLVSSLAEVELRKRAASVNGTSEKLEQAADIFKQLGSRSGLEKSDVG